MNKLKRKALLLIANNMAPEEVAGLRAIFQVRALDWTILATAVRYSMKKGLLHLAVQGIDS